MAEELKDYVHARCPVETHGQVLRWVHLTIFEVLFSNGQVVTRKHDLFINLPSPFTALNASFFELFNLCLSCVLWLAFLFYCFKHSLRFLLKITGELIIDIFFVPKLQISELRILLEDLPHDSFVLCWRAVSHKDCYLQLLDIILFDELVNLQPLIVFSFLPKQLLGLARGKIFLYFSDLFAIVEGCETLPFTIFLN